MTLTRRILFTAALVAATILLLALPAQAATMSDIRGNWAESSIRKLASAGVVSGYPDGTFKPNKPVTRAEFAKMVVKAFHPETTGTRTFPDVQGHWAASYVNQLGKDYLTGYKDGTFRPDRNITRAEVVAVLTRVMKMGGSDGQSLKPTTASFSDVDSKYWAFAPIEIANRVGILPNYESTFHPDQAASRAETAYMLSKTRDLKVVAGTVSSVDLSNNSIAVLPAGAELITIPVDGDTQVFRNNAGTTFDNVAEGDNVRAIVGPDGTARYLRADGVANSSDVAARVSNYLKGRITPDQVKAVIAGDWGSVKDGFKSDLYDQLLKYGATPDEAESILMADWNSLSQLGKDRLASSVGTKLGLSPDLVQMIMSQNVTDLANQTGSSGLMSSVTAWLQNLPKLW